MYFVVDYFEDLISWKDSAAKATIFGPNGSWSEVVPIVPSEDLTDAYYFVIGCFSNSGSTGFKKVAEAEKSLPSLKNCPSKGKFHAKNAVFSIAIFKNF